MKLSSIKQYLEAVPGAKVQETEYSKKGFLLDVAVSPEHLVEAVTIVDREGFFIETITGVDWLGEKEAAVKEAAAKAAAIAEAKAKAAAAKAAKAAEEAAASGEPAGEEIPPAAPVAAAPEVVPEPAPAAQKSVQIDDLEAVYDFNHYEEFCRVVIRVRTPRNNPVIPTISDIYQAAHWHERETHDFFGIKFAGHPYLVPLLLPEDAAFHPLLKDFNS